MRNVKREMDAHKHQKPGATHIQRSAGPGETCVPQRPGGRILKGLAQAAGRAFALTPKSALRLGFEHLAATVKAGGADVVAQMHFAGGGLFGQVGGGQRVVRTVHAALGGRFLVLLNGHYEIGRASCRERV